MQELRETLTRAVRTSAPEIDRRVDPRVSADFACSLEIAGQSRTEARMLDFSASGARVGTAGSLTAGQTGHLLIAGLGTALAFTVVEKTSGVARLRFTGTDDARGEVRSLVQRLAGQSALLAAAA